MLIFQRVSAVEFLHKGSDSFGQAPRATPMHHVKPIFVFSEQDWASQKWTDQSILVNPLPVLFCCLFPSTAWLVSTSTAPVFRNLPGLAFRILRRRSSDHSWTCPTWWRSSAAVNRQIKRESEWSTPQWLWLNYDNYWWIINITINIIHSSSLNPVTLWLFNIAMV